jgi:hypothetical protein
LPIGPCAVFARGTPFYRKMQRAGLDRGTMNEDRAFAFLVRASSHGNIKLRAIAQEVVDQRNAK